MPSNVLPGAAVPLSDMPPFPFSLFKQAAVSMPILLPNDIVGSTTLPNDRSEASPILNKVMFSNRPTIISV